MDASESAFIAGQSIHDNILITFELIHSMRNKTKWKTGEVALKIDISKAYDWVDWSYLERILRRMGFREVWIGSLFLPGG